MCRFIQLFLLTFFLISCTENVKLEKVKIVYMDQYGLTPSLVSCNHIFAYDPREIEVTEEAFLKKLDNIIKEIKNSNHEECNNDVDVRIASLLKYSNGKADTLCMGAFRGTMLNGQVICDDKNLSKLMRELVYPYSEHNSFTLNEN